MSGYNIELASGRHATVTMSDELTAVIEREFEGWFKSKLAKAPTQEQREDLEAFDVFAKYVWKAAHESFRAKMQAMEKQVKVAKEALAKIKDHHGLSADYNVKYSRLKNIATEALACLKSNGPITSEGK